MRWHFTNNNLVIVKGRWSTKLGNSLLNSIIKLILHLLPLWMIEGVLLSFPLFAFILCHWGQCLILSMGEGIDYYTIIIIRKGYILLLGYIISIFLVYVWFICNYVLVYFRFMCLGSAFCYIYIYHIFHSFPMF